jgi:hypothetical protein
MLHQAGFHWARSRGAWSRQLTNAAWASAHSAAGKLTENSLPSSESLEPTSQEAPGDTNSTGDSI